MSRIETAICDKHATIMTKNAVPARPGWDWIWLDGSWRLQHMLRPKKIGRARHNRLVHFRCLDEFRLDSKSARCSKIGLFKLRGGVTHLQ